VSFAPKEQHCHEVFKAYQPFAAQNRCHTMPSHYSYSKLNEIVAAILAMQIMHTSTYKQLSSLPQAAAEP
jgi:hypothetical protein